jgi:hypothetical protein
MARRTKVAGLDPLIDLEKKTKILERELSVQRQALDRLKQLAKSRHTRRVSPLESIRKTA